MRYSQWKEFNTSNQFNPFNQCHPINLTLLITHAVNSAIFGNMNMDVTAASPFPRISFAFHIPDSILHQDTSLTIHELYLKFID